MYNGLRGFCFAAFSEKQGKLTDREARQLGKGGHRSAFFQAKES